MTEEIIIEKKEVEIQFCSTISLIIMRIIIIIFGRENKLFHDT